MTNFPKILVPVLFLGFCSGVGAQEYQSYEGDTVPSGYEISGGNLSISHDRYKNGQKSLKIEWNGPAVLEITDLEGIQEASKSKNGGINLWVYNEIPVDAQMIFTFCDRDGAELCRLPFRLAFEGWRSIWAKFQADMGKVSGKEQIASAKIIFPADASGTTYFDILAFPKTVSWMNMSDAQYSVYKTEFALTPNFMAYRTAEPKVDKVIASTEDDMKVISDRLTRWYLGSGDAASGGSSAGKLVALRQRREKAFIAEGVDRADDFKIGYGPLFQYRGDAEINGEKCVRFRDLNEFVLLPLALDWRKNGNRESLDKAIAIYDWFYDQGWADGSGLGSLTFEKLRSCGYFHSYFLLKDELDAERYMRELNAINWFSLFGMCYTEPASKGEVADNLRALAIPKLIYAMSLPDGEQRMVAMTAYKNYMDNALGLAPGYFGTFKPDYSGYHHRGPYHSAYYNHALYAGALVAYLLHDTPYALSDETLDNIKKGLLAFRFFSGGLDVPAGTVGRFPKGQRVLQELIPAFAYVALSYEQPDRELIAALKRLLEEKEYRPAIKEYVEKVNSTLAYTSTVGEMELVAQAAAMDIEAEDAPEGSVFMPYSGLLVSKDEDMHFNAKGFSKYIWDFESSATENLHGRYLAYGHLEYFDFRNGNRSFLPQQPDFDWSYISGTTVKALPADRLKDKGGASSGHRNYSDQAFLAGVSGGDDVSMFSVRLHDITYDTTFRADKSVFFFDDMVVCLGTGIGCADNEYPVVTSLFQDFTGTADVPEKTAKGYIIDDGSFTYAVADGKVQTFAKDGYSRAFINHGASPENQSYLYYILKDRSHKEAKKLLKKPSVTVVRADSDAHIVSDSGTGTVCGAIFNASAQFDQTVRRTNIPLAYILEKEDGGALRLSVCEPDMRMRHVAHMGLLTEEDVITPAKPFETKIWLDGEYRCDNDNVTARYDKASGLTELTFVTTEGRQVKISLVPSLD